MSARNRLHELGATARRRVLWGALAAVLFVASLLTLGQSHRMRSQLIADATTSAETLVETALTPELLELNEVAPVSSGGRYEDLVSAVDRSVLADGTVKAVTIWAAVTTGSMP